MTSIARRAALTAAVGFCLTACEALSDNGVSNGDRASDISTNQQAAAATAQNVNVVNTPNVNVASLPAVNVATLPATLPPVNVASMPSVNVATLPQVDVATLPPVDIASMPAVTLPGTSVWVGTAQLMGVPQTVTVGPVDTSSYSKVRVVFEGCGNFNYSIVPRVTIPNANLIPLPIDTDMNPSFDAWGSKVYDVPGPNMSFTVTTSAGGGFCQMYIAVYGSRV